MTVAKLGALIPERSLSPLIRASVRRVSATDAAARTTAIFEKALADLTGRLERVEGEKAGLRRETAEKDACLEALFQTTNAALQAQAGVIAGLRAELIEAKSMIGGLAASLDVFKGEYDKHDHLIHDSSMGNTWQGWFRTKSAKISASDP